MDLHALTGQPFALLQELERYARAALRATEDTSDARDEWVGLAFRLGSENFVANRADVREVMPVPEQMTRVPGSKPWLRGVTNVRGQLMTIVDLRAFLGSGGGASDRRNRVLVMASRDVPTGLIVDQVFGFRRFSETEYESDAPVPRLRCEQYLRGAYRRASEVWPQFDFSALLEDQHFLNAGDTH